MTQEEEELLLQDLCARLPYGVKGMIKADTVVPHKYDMDGFPVETTFDVDVELQRVDVSNDEIFVSTFDNDEDLGNYIEESQIDGSPWIIEEFKPYLRSMPSMTEGEKEELERLSEEYFGKALDKQIQEFLLSSNRNESRVLEYIASSFIIDWLNKKMFDYRGLIEKGLAFEAPEDMYKTK